jgi:hypothetical protein
MKKSGHLVAGLVAAALMSGSAVASPAAPFEKSEIQAAADEAYAYFYPLITMDVTRTVMTNLPAGMVEGLGPVNAFHHRRSYPDAEARTVVRPNFDTLYSLAWLDLSEGPVIVSMPATDGRYYILPFYDMWTEVFAAPGWRTSGTEAADWALVPPGWQGELPDGVRRIDAPTTDLWIISRIQTNGPADYENVHAIQDRMAIVPLAHWGSPDWRPAAVTPDAGVDMKTDPMQQVHDMPAAAYFARAGELLRKHSPHPTDWAVLERMRRLGLEAGKPFDIAALDPDVRAALEAAPSRMQALMKEARAGIGDIRNGWLIGRSGFGVYGNDYLKRAIITMLGLGAVSPEDAIYPMNLADADGQPLTGERDYVLHFEKEDLPPANGFWSVTMYDEEGFQVANPIDRFAIGDRDALTFNKDGSLDLYLQHENPGKDRESNWLPAPASGKLGVTMRLFGPAPEVVDGRWAPPAIRRVQ